VIARLRGFLVEKDPTRVVVECAGVGYVLKVPLSTSRSLPDVGQEAALVVHTHFTRDGVALYGFIDPAERDMFCRITAAKGVGPRAGLNLLSRWTPQEINEALSTGRAQTILVVPGIGPKRAESIIRKLTEEQPAAPAGSPLLADAEAALVSLGLTQREARERVAKVIPAPEMNLQDLLRLVLSQRG
jgi:Holliday junction DNA helicase RuvA